MVTTNIPQHRSAAQCATLLQLQRTVLKN